MNKARQLPPLVDGTIVYVSNCVGTYRVVRRVRPNVYLVEFKGQTVEMLRRTLKPVA